MKTYKIKFDQIDEYLSGGATHVYDMIEESLKKSEIKEPFISKQQKDACKLFNGDEVKLSCESGKILKYLLRIEINSIKKKNKDDKTVKHKSNIVKIDEINKKSYIDTNYLTKIIDNIVSFSGSLKSKLDECTLMRTVDMVSLSKILLEEFTVDQNGALVPKSKEDRDKAIAENKKKEVALTPQNIMNAKGNIISTITKTVTEKEDNKNIKLLVGVVVIMGLYELSKHAPIAGQVVAGIAGAVAIGVIASRIRANKIYGSSVMPKDKYVENLQLFINVLNNFKTEINDNKYKFSPTYNINTTASQNQPTQPNITTTNGKLYVSSFCVTSVKSNCQKIEYIEKNVNGKIIKEKIVTKMDPSTKQFVKGMLKYMENVFDVIVSTDDQNIPSIDAILKEEDAEVIQAEIVDLNTSASPDDSKE